MCGWILAPGLALKRKKQPVFRSDAELKAHLDQLEKLGAPELRAEWAKVYERPAPRHISRDLLLRGIAYRIQVQMYGGLKPAAVKRLKEIAVAMKDGRDLPKAPKRELQPGVRLLREWKGQTHIVEVLSEGFAWRGKTYGSLSKIAHLITGLSWSGPIFFGLRDKRRRVTPDLDKLAERLK
ncbi:MAG: DUF2924 domain-containing protein [Rhizomicrobium sp.]